MLHTSLAKKRSNVNLFRHQQYTNASSFKNEAYIILKIKQLLQVINGNQVFKCILGEDQNKLMKKYLKNSSHKFINVMIVPEISGVINIKQKLCLKVFEPLVVIDASQSFIEISKFVALANADIAEDNNISKIRDSDNLNLVYDFHCPCIDERCLSDKCTKKFCEIEYNYPKELFDC